VEGTTYPRAKAERLPEVANFYNQLELELSLLMNDAAWLERFKNPMLKAVPKFNLRKMVIPSRRVER
jgi:hypothetical protein